MNYTHMRCVFVLTDDVYRYFVRAKVLKRILDTTVEKDIWVFSYRPPPEGNAAIKMEVGIEQSLHIEFEYNKSR